jgi:membrane protease YdiL (CAAX protease family)
VSSTVAALDVDAPVAPWWHTALVLLIFAAGAVADRHHFVSIPPARLSARASEYIAILLMEWLVVLLIWVELRRRKLSLNVLIAARWRKASTILKDLGWAIAFLLVATPILDLIGRLARARYDATAILPTTWFEMSLWLAVAATAGFCEELTFRGYLDRQFRAWSGYRAVGILLQGIAFGLTHAYQGWKMMIVITVFGWMFGAFALWRKSLAPGMLAHGIQDGVGGLVVFLSRR